MEPILETEEAESSLQSSQTNFKKLRRLPSPAEWKEFSRSLGVIRAGLEAGDPKFGMSLQEAKEVYERVEDCVNLVMKQQGQVRNLEDREKKKTADLASSQQEIMNLKKQLSLATQRLTEAEESIKESRQKAVPPEEVEQLFMRLADFESLAQNAFDAEALSEASVASILGGLTGSKPRSALGSPYTPLEDKENVEVETSKLRRAVEEAEEEAKSAKQTSVQALLEAEGYKEELEKANGAIDSIKKELGDVQRAMRRETRDLQTVQNVCRTQHQALLKEQRRSHALAEELRRTKVEGVLNATIGKEALSTGVPASKEDVETRRDDVSETTASSSSAEAVVAIFREHVVDTQGLLEDEMANVNTVLDVQEEVLHALRRVTEDRTDLRTRLKIKQSETDQVRRDLENAEAQVATVTEELRASEEKASQQNSEMSGLLSKLQASHDDLQQQLQHTQAALQAQEQQKMSDSAVAAEATQSLQAANVALQTKIDELQSQVEAKQKELAALAETLQDSEAKATDAATQLLTAQLKVASEERESLESQLHSAQEALQVRESHSKDLQSQLEAARVQQAEASSELEAKKQELEAQVAAVTEELRASEEKASQQSSEMSGLLSVAQTLQASHDDLQQQLQHTQAALQAQEQQKMSDSAVAAEATQSLQAANAALQTKIDELQSQVEAKQQKELAALEQTLQDGSAHAQQVQSEAACFDISTPRSSKSPWAESPEAAQVAEVAGAEQSGLLAENRLLRERLSAFEEEKATSLQALREQVMLLARENYDLKHGVRQAEASPMEAKEVPAGSGAASEGDQRWWLSAIFSPFLTEGDMREIHAQSRLDEADG